MIINGQAIAVDDMGEDDLASLHAAVCEALDIDPDPGLEPDPIDTEQFARVIADADRDELEDLLAVLNERLEVEIEE